LRLVALGGCLVALAVAAPAPAAPVPAAGGADLFRSMEGGGATVVGTVLQPRHVEGPAWRAELRIESALDAEIERGAVVPIVWEERARARPVRFGDGDRVLVVLGPLSGHSVWRQRFPEYAERSRLLMVAADGGAFLRAPRFGEVTTLEHFLGLAPEDRELNAGVGYLVRLVESGQPLLAEAAVGRLDRVGRLDSQLDPTSAQRLVAALLRTDLVPRQRDALLALIGERKLESLREPLEARANSGVLAPAPIFEGLGRLDGELTPAQTLRLVSNPDSPAHRAAGARYATGPESEKRLERLLRRDGAPEVRAAALTRLVELRGVDAIDRAVYGLEDEDPEVREAAIRSIGTLGPEAVQALREIVDSGSPYAAQGAVGALSLAGGEAGYRALVEIAETHPDEGVRTLARTALGRPIGHRHE
jgi:hypothetical protein